MFGGAQVSKTKATPKQQSEQQDLNLLDLGLPQETKEESKPDGFGFLSQKTKKKKRDQDPLNLMDAFTNPVDANGGA